MLTMSLGALEDAPQENHRPVNIRWRSSDLLYDRDDFIERAGLIGRVES